MDNFEFIVAAVNSYTDHIAALEAVKAERDAIAGHNLRNYDLAQKNIKEVMRLEAAAEAYADEVRGEIRKIRERDKTVEQRMRAEKAERALEDVKSNLTNEQKEITLLRIIDGMGGRTDASDSTWCWLNWFCSDEVHNVHSDTFNRCIEKGWLTSTHDSSFDTSEASLTTAGRAAFSALVPSPALEANQQVIETLRAALAAVTPEHEPWMDRFTDETIVTFYRQYSYGDLRRSWAALTMGSE